MSRIDYLAVDAALLKTLVVLHEEQSVTQAADRLGLTQSALSHRLTRIKALFGTTVFVRSGRKIASTPEAEELVHEARTVLMRIERMVNPQPLSLADLTEDFVIAATDYERHLFLLKAAKMMLTEAPSIKMSLVWEKYDNRQGLRDGQFDLACGPMLGHRDADIHIEKIFQDQFLCFYDPDVRTAPSEISSYFGARHARMIFSRDDSSFVDLSLTMHGMRRDVAVDIPSLSEVPETIRGTPLVVTAPSIVAKTVMADFASCAVPFDIPAVSFGMEWHDRTDASPRHSWMRSCIRKAALSNANLR